MSEPSRTPVDAHLSIVMPVYNEADVIEKVVRDYTTILASFTRSELVIVDDGSSDATREILGNIAAADPRVRVFHNERNSGHGPTLLRAYRESKGDYIFYVDSDDQFVADDFWILWDKMQAENLDMAIGKRFPRRDPFARLVITVFLKSFLLLTFGRWFTDPNAPFRIVRRRVLDALLPFLPAETGLPSISMTVGAFDKGFSVAWTRVRHLPRLKGHSFFRSFRIFRLVFSACAELLAFKLRLRNGAHHSTKPIA